MVLGSQVTTQALRALRYRFISVA